MTQDPAACPIGLFTIGFTGKSAREFFTRLRDAGVREVIDIRLNNVSQLAGFTKKADLAYFLDAIAGIRYRHLPDLAPTKAILDAYRRGEIDWSGYETRFLELLRERRPEQHLAPQSLDGGCLLCSEAVADQCHRRLVAEYLRGQWGERVTIQHL